MQANLETSVAIQDSTTLPEQNVNDEAVPGELNETMATPMDYAEDLTLNAPLQPLDGEHDFDSKNKARRYWTAAEEERFYEIWGRDNWRLTRHGKNTVFFAKWADELRDRYDLDIKPEEIQAKVNQTRAKFRQVKKTIQSGGGSSARWKKYTIIDSILKNQFRPKDAEPIPKEALERNRDVTPPPTKSINTDASPAPVATPTSVITTQADQLSMDNSTSSEHNISSGYFNPSDPSRLSYNSELFTDNYDEIKQEYDEEAYRVQQQQYQQQQTQNESNYSPVEEATLHELQTPQQLQQQQQQQQYQTQYESSLSQPAHQSNTLTINEHQETPNTYGGSTNEKMNNDSEYNNNATPKSNVATYLQQHNNTATTNGTMQPPARAAAILDSPLAPANTVATIRGQSSSARKRGRPYGSAAVGGNVAAMDTLEATYLEEVRRKNQLLEDQVQISRRRLELEERKVALMTQFFPKCLEQQAQILARLQPN